MSRIVPGPAEDHQDDTPREAVDPAWAERISFRTLLGAVHPEMLTLSPDGLEVGKRKIRLEKITWIRWGAETRSLFSVPVSAQFFLAVGNEKRQISFEMDNERIFAIFTDKLWYAVAGRLMRDMLLALRDGAGLVFGEMIVSDTGVALPQPRLFGAGEKVFYDWRSITFQSYNGCLLVQSLADSKVNAFISYGGVRNAHILESLLHQKAQIAGPRLSMLLDRFT